VAEESEAERRPGVSGAVKSTSLVVSARGPPDQASGVVRSDTGQDAMGGDDWREAETVAHKRQQAL